jgi:hypothetical protein
MFEFIAQVAAIAASTGNGFTPERMADRLESKIDRLDAKIDNSPLTWPL